MTGCFSTDHRGAIRGKVYVAMEDGRRGYTSWQFHPEWASGQPSRWRRNPDRSAPRGSPAARSAVLMKIGGTLCFRSPRSMA